MSLAIAIGAGRDPKSGINEVFLYLVTMDTQEDQKQVDYLSSYRNKKDFEQFHNLPIG